MSYQMKVFVSIVFLLIFALSLFVSFYAIYSFYRAISNIDPRKSVYSHLLAPFAIFIPGLFNDEGALYRRRFFASLLIAALGFVFVFIVKSQVMGKY